MLGGGTVAAAGTGLSLVSGGMLSVVGAPAAAGGIALAGHGAAMFGQGVKNILKAEGPPSSSRVRTFNDIPTLDGTGKLHGPIPKRSEWTKWSRSELEVLVDHLRKSIKKRSFVNKTHPNKSKLPGHSRRLNDEIDLLRDINHFLYGK